MQPGYSHITLLCDRSGSMSPIRDAAQSGVREFVNDQRRAPGRATLHLIDFSSPVFKWGETKEPVLDMRDIMSIPAAHEGYRSVYQGDIQSAPTYVLTPKGMTALLDALGKAITDTGQFLANLPEPERPEHVFFVVQTDGEENSSHSFTKSVISRMIKHQEEVYNWTFVYLGMGLETFDQGADLGFANAVHAAGTAASYGSSYAATSSNMTATRGGAKGVNWNVDVDDSGNVNVVERK